MFEFKKIANFSLLLLILGFLFIILVNLFGYSFIFADDTELYCNSFKELFISPSNGLFISSILCKLFAVFIPLHLDIHPSFFKSNYFCYIESFVILLFVFILNSLLFRNKKLNWLYHISFLFLLSMLFLFIEQQPFLLLFTYEGFFRMLLPSFLFVVLFSLLLINIEKKTFIIYLGIYIVSFLCSISNEFVCISTFIGFLIYFLLSFKKLKCNRDFILYMLLILISFLGIFILCKTGAFTRKSTSAIDINYIKSLFEQILPFSKSYFKYVILDHILFYALLIIQSFLLLIRYGNYKDVQETIKFIICFIIGNLIFFYMLIGLGRTHYFEGQYWVIHYDLHVMFNIMLCAFNLSLLSLLLKYKLTGDFVVGLLFSILTVFVGFHIYDYYSNLRNEMNQWRVEIYKNEKAIRLANMKNKIIVLDEELYNNNYNWGLFYSPKNKEKNKLFPKSAYIIFLNQFEKENKINQYFMFSSKESFENAYRDNGGMFSEEELMDVNFNNLRDRNFIIKSDKPNP